MISAGVVLVVLCGRSKDVDSAAIQIKDCLLSSCSGSRLLALFSDVTKADVILGVGKKEQVLCGMGFRRAISSGPRF